MMQPRDQILSLPGLGVDVDRVDDQHQGTPWPVAAFLADLIGLDVPADCDRRRLFPYDVAAAPETALAPRWGGQQLDGGFIDVLALDDPWPPGWWCNPPFGFVCLDCGGCSPVPKPKKKGDPPSCRQLGHRIINMAVWARRLAREARRAPGVVLCKLDTSTLWYSTLLAGAVCRVEFIGDRVQYLTAVDGQLAQRRGADFCSTAFILGPGATGAPPVLYATTTGKVVGASPGAQAALDAVRAIVRSAA